MSSTQSDNLDDIFKKIVNELYKNDEIDALGMALGLTEGDIGRATDENARQGTTYMGTLGMLRNWRKKQTTSKERENLKEALIKAGFQRLLRHFSNDQLAQPVTGTPTTSTSSGASSETPRRNEGNETAGAVDRVQPDANGYYTYEIKQAVPTEEQLDLAKNYKMDVLRKGHMFIHNTGGLSGDRPGSEVDVQNVQHVFKELGYDLETHADLTAAEFEKELKEFVNSSKHKGMCSVVIMLMGHGDATEIYGKDKPGVPREWVNDLVSGMQSMNGKPKMIFYQCCRGGEEPKEVQTDALPSNLMPARHTGRYLESDKPIPANSDMVIVHATTSGNVAYRDQKNGSWFIQMLSEVLLENAHNTDLNTMLEQVTSKVGTKVTTSKEEPENMTRQAPVVVKQGISKRIYFLPKYAAQIQSP